MSSEDRAQEHEFREWEMRNVGRRKLVDYLPGEPGYGPEECDECGDEMPDVRRAMGEKLCTDCKAALERRNKGY